MPCVHGTKLYETFCHDKTILEVSETLCSCITCRFFLQNYSHFLKNCYFFLPRKCERNFFIFFMQINKKKIAHNLTEEEIFIKFISPQFLVNKILNPYLVKTNVYSKNRKMPDVRIFLSTIFRETKLKLN